MGKYQRRYVAYAKAHGTTPEEIERIDRETGGAVVHFSPWIRRKWAEFDRLTGKRYRIGDGHTCEGHAAFDAWLLADVVQCDICLKLRVEIAHVTIIGRERVCVACALEQETSAAHGDQ